MGQPRFSQIVAVSMILALLTGLTGVVHYAIKATIAAQKNTTLCVTIPPQLARCFTDEIILSTQPVTALATNPFGTRLVSTNRNIIEVWDLITRQKLRSLNGHRQRVTALAVSPDGKTLASASLDGTIHLWDLYAGQVLVTFSAKHTTVLAFSPNGRILASGSGLVQTANSQSFQPIQLWDVSTGQLLTQLDMSGPVAAIAISPNGQQLAAGDRQTDVWDLTTQQHSYTLNSGDLNSLIFSSDNKLLLTGSNGIQGEDGIKFWQASTGKLVRVLDSVANNFSLTSDNSLLLTTYGGAINLWQMKPFRYLGTLRGSTYSGVVAEFGLGGRMIAIGSSEGIKVWVSHTSNVERYQPSHRFPLPLTALKTPH